METINTDIAIIGGGPGGYVCAIRSLQLGADVVLIEKENVGGVCLNHGCIPSKALIHASEVLEQTRNSAKIGIKVESVSVDFPKVIAWKSRVVKKLTMGIRQLVEGNGGTILNGSAKFVEPGLLAVKANGEEVKVSAKHVVIATGASTIEIPNIPFDGQTVISSREALDLQQIPESMIVIGGGVIGLELGQTYARFGTAVTVVEALDSLLPFVPADLLDPLFKKMRRLKMKFYTGAKAKSCTVENGRATCTVQLNDQTTEILEAEKVLVTVGTRPNTKEINLDATQVELDDQGVIRIDNKCETTHPGIFAIGDVTGAPLLAHKASAQGIVTAETIAGHSASIEFGTIPSVIYTDPEIATVGLSEKLAEEKGMDIIVGKYPLAGHGRAATMDRLDGFIKTIADKDDHRIVGLEIVGAQAGELIGHGVLALENDLRIEALSEAIFPHPTLSEGIAEAAQAALGMSIHGIQKK